jgi:Zn-ribbon RNA-binding protein
MNCTSCNTHISASDNFVKFKCPSCNEQLIVRCGICRNNTVKYTCKKCGFAGP